MRRESINSSIKLSVKDLTSLVPCRVPACLCEEAEGVCAQCVAPYISSVLEALAEKISAGFSEMQQTLRTQMDAVLTHKGGGTEETKKVKGQRATTAPP